MCKKLFLALALLVAFHPLLPAQSQPAPVVSKMDWWRKARFGMFIHWGVYSVPAGVYHGQDIPGLGEWIMQDAKIPVAEYKTYAKQFNPTHYDPEAWVKMAKNAGVKYIVITAKHHDGFALFDTKASDWNVVQATPYGKDLLKPLADACRKYGMKLGFYYSQANDWCNPGGAAAFGKWDPAQQGSMDDYIDKVAIPQVREILTNYGDVAELWWDVPSDMTPERAQKFLPVLQLQPNIIYNNRLGGNVPGDIETPEQYIPPTGIAGRDWETCMTVNDTWGYKTKDENWKSAADLIRNLVDAASKGGNYLLNIGPKPDGSVPQPIVDRFAAIGKWMKVNSESIYGTSASPFKKLHGMRATRLEDAHGTTLYLHVMQWPTNGELLVPGLHGAPGMKASLLATGAKLVADTSTAGLVIHVPVKAPDAVVSVVKLYLPGTLQIDSYTIKPTAPGTYDLQAEDADVHNPPNDMALALEEHDGIFNAGYWTNARSYISWTVQVDQPGNYRMSLKTALPNGTTSVEISATLDGQTFASNTVAIGATGDYQRYTSAAAGGFTLPKAGKYTITVKPASSAPWQPINLRSLTLQRQ